MDRLAAEFNVKPKGIVHVGAHYGEEAGAYHEAGVERVLWVEANDTLLPTLNANIAPYTGQQAVHGVISDKDDETVTFRTASFSMSAGILKMTGHHTYYPSIVETGDNPMTSVTVDTLMMREGIDPAGFDMLNVDIEGAELLAMKGARKLLENVEWIYSEVYFEELHEGEPLISDLDWWLAVRGFVRVACEDTGFGWGDAVYVRV